LLGFLCGGLLLRPAFPLCRGDPGSCVGTQDTLAEAFRIGVPPRFDILPSYNIAPQTFQPVIFTAAVLPANL